MQDPECLLVKSTLNIPHEIFEFFLGFPHFPNIETVECLFLRLTVKRHVFEGSLKPPPPPHPPPPGFLLQSQFKTLSFERNSKIFRTKNR